jgi:hypothetical protein
MGAFQQWLFKTNPQLIEATLFHTIQRAAVGHLEELISKLRAVRTAEDCAQLQQDLFDRIFQAEEIEHEATQRIRLGDSSLDRRAEQLAAGRAARQLRTVGDALAWMVTGGQRLAIVALSQNQQPGRIYGKGGEGRQAELDAVNFYWRQGHFALLHDLTNCLRINDITVCHRLHRADVGDHDCPSDAFSISEIKANRRAKPSAEQKQRQSDALTAINHGGPIITQGGSRQAFVASAAYANHEDALGRVLDAAMDAGVGGEVVEPGWVISAARFPGWPKGTPFLDILRAWEETRAGLLERAGMEHDEVYRLQSGDAAGRAPQCVPLCLYPMADRAAAFLTADWIFFDSLLSVSYLESQLSKRQGLSVKRDVVDKHHLAVISGDHEIHLSRTALEHVLLELVDTRVLAEALEEWANKPGFAGPGELILPLR